MGSNSQNKLTEVVLRSIVNYFKVPPDRDVKPSKIVRFLSAMLGTSTWGLVAFFFIFKEASLKKIFDPEGYPTELGIMLFAASTVFARLFI